MHDQAFGRAQPEEEESGDGETQDYASLIRAQRAALIAKVLQEKEEQRAASGDSTDLRDDEAAPPPPGHPPAR